MKVELLGSLNLERVKGVIAEALEIKLENYDELVESIKNVDDLINCYEEQYEKTDDNDSKKSELFNCIQGYTYRRLELQQHLDEYNKVDELAKEISDIEKERGTEIVAAAARLSRAAGDVFDIVGLSESKTFEQNLKLVERVLGMGHDSISDHDYCVFAIKDVSPVIEQILIEERIVSFTIKSRREADFSNAGFYVPDFHDEKGNIIPNNEQVKKEYIDHMESLFKTYSDLKGMGMKQEDARFVLPYSFHSNIIMGMDAHCVKDLIIKLTKTKYANITEVREFGERLYEIVKEQKPYLVPLIEAAETKTEDPVDKLVMPKGTIKKSNLTKPVMINHSDGVDGVDRSICLAAIMRRTGYSLEDARIMLDDNIAEDPKYMETLIRTIVFKGDGEELKQVAFQFQIPLSYAILTHLARHRTHHLLTQGFVPNPDLTRYIVPPRITSEQEDIYHNSFKENKKMYDKFKNEYNIRPEDLVYFTMAGVMTNSISSMDGKTVRHILEKRECTKAQWETQRMANGIHKEIAKLPGAEIFSSILGATCTTLGLCFEGKECCGKVYSLSNCQMPPRQ